MLNFVSVLLNKSMLTQILLGVVWLLMSSAMLLQLIVFNFAYKKRLTDTSADVSFRKLEIAIYVAVLLIILTNMGSYAVPQMQHMRSQPEFYGGCPDKLVQSNKTVLKINVSILITYLLFTSEELSALPVCNSENSYANLIFPISIALVAIRIIMIYLYLKCH